MILFLKFKQKTQTVFLDKNSRVTLLDDTKYHIILSPTLYWIKREKLPLKYLHEVKKIAPTLFEEILPEGDYSYSIYKEDEYFVLFAYEDKKILSLLAEKGILLADIATISFAQSAFTQLQKPVAISSETILVKKDDIVVVLPAEWYEDVEALQNIELKPSKHTIKLEQFSHIVDKKTLYKLGAILGVFGVIVAVEYLLYSKALAHLRQENEQVFKAHKLKPTLMQNKAILSHYESISLRQERLREYISYILKAKLSKNQKIDAISYENKKLRVVFEGLQGNALKRVLAPFYKDKAKVDIHKSKNQTIVEVAL
jgi:hypothetical protein